MIPANQNLETLTVNPEEVKDRPSLLKKVVYNNTIRVENLNVTIEGQHILKDINLAIPEKSITCIIGPSGCGKTTFLKTLNRMHDDKPEIKIKGRVYVDDLNIYDKGVNVIDTRKKMGLLAQRPCPLPMSIFDNLY
jgi:phosphate transport system ATP-binding protein